MASVTFSTPSGSKITLELISSIDETLGESGIVRTRTVNWLHASINGETQIADVKRITHPVVGAAVSIGNKTAPVPAAALAEVDALFAAWSAEEHARAERMSARLREEAEYDRHAAAIARDFLPRGSY